MLPSLINPYLAYLPASIFPRIDVASRVAHGLEYRVEFIALVVVMYLASVYGMKEWVKWRGKPYDLKMPLAAWNFFLASASGYLLLWTLKGIHSTYTTQAESAWEMVCDQHQHHESADWIAPLHVVFLTKYLELIDTAFLCLRALGVDIWFKRYLTIIQISQFVATLIPSVIVLGSRIIWTITGGKNAYPCNGSWYSAILGSAILLSYLYLFLQLYLTRFDASGMDKKKMVVSTALREEQQREGEILIKSDMNSYHVSTIPSPIGVVHNESENLATFLPSPMSMQQQLPTMQQQNPNQPQQIPPTLVHRRTEGQRYGGAGGS